MSKTYPCCVANAAGAACACGMSDENVLLREIRKLSGAVKQAERERDEARAAWSRALGERDTYKERSEQAVALLREALDKACDCEEGRTCGSCEYNTRKDAFLAGQPAPVKAEVDDAVVERACAAMWNGVWPHDCVNPDDQRNDMRAALVAALEGRT